MGRIREFFVGPDITESAPKVLDEPAKVARSGFEYAVGPTGIDEHNQGLGGATFTDRRSQLSMLWDAFLACPWAWASVNAVARTITAGGLEFDWDADDGEGDQETPDKPPNVIACERLFKFTNPREDIRQLLRGVISDLLVFGDAFIEVVWLGNQPVALFSLDSPSMFVVADQHGTITGYVQSTELGQEARFDPRDVIHISMDSPRSGMYGTPPMQAAMLPITTWLFTAATLKQIYRKGNPPSIAVALPGDYKPVEVQRWRAKYATENVGPQNIGTPIVVKGGTGNDVHELQSRRIEELLHTKDQARDEVLAAFGVPPAEASIIESGNLGGGTGEAQRRQFLTNTCAPIAALVLEKLDFALVKRGFGIVGWHLKFDEVDMRDSEVVERIRDIRVRNGSWVLNKYRAEIGEPPVDGGDQAVLVDRQNIVVWRDMETFSTASIAAKTKGTALEPDEHANGSPVTLHKPEPKPVPPALAQHAGIPPEQPEDAPPDGEGGQAPPPPGKPGKPAAKETARATGRPVRESWATYSARVRQAMAELPRGD